MKYCGKCGKELADNASFCAGCGQAVGAQPQQPAQQPVQQPVYQAPPVQQPVYQQPVYQAPPVQQPAYQQPSYQQGYYQQPAQQPQKDSGMVIAIKVLLILGALGTVYSWFSFLPLIPLCWCIPMIITYFRKIKRNEPIGTGFKVCSLLFVSLIAGILMFCDKEH